MGVVVGKLRKVLETGSGEYARPVTGMSLGFGLAIFGTANAKPRLVGFSVRHTRGLSG